MRESLSQLIIFQAFFKTVVAACCGRSGGFLSLAKWKGKMDVTIFRFVYLTASCQTLPN
jgi:hypothetical protein